MFNEHRVRTIELWNWKTTFGLKFCLKISSKTIYFVTKSNTVIAINSFSCSNVFWFSLYTMLTYWQEIYNSQSHMTVLKTLLSIYVIVMGITKCEKVLPRFLFFLVCLKKKYL